MATSAIQNIRSVISTLRLDRDWSLIFIAMAIGFVMSLVAMAFITPLHMMEELAVNVATHHPEMLWWLIPLFPVGGALLCGLVTKIVPSGEGEGPAVSKVMFCIHRRKSRIKWYVAVRKWLASTFTIASGGSAGAEGPIVTIGATIGSNIGQLLGTAPQNTATLLGCGAAAGIASVFNAPIAGVFFVMEILLRDFSLRTFTPIVVASVISAASTQAILGNDLLFPGAAQLSVEQAFHWAEIPNYLVLGVICGCFASVFIRSFYWVMGKFDRLNVPRLLRPAIGASMLGLTGLGFFALSQHRHVPEFYGNGYSVIAGLLEMGTYYEDVEHTQLLPLGPILLGLVALGLLKGIATCLTLGSGGAGGVFAPSLLLGATTGAAFGMVVNTLGWFPSASPAHYALVGMAAMFAATTHAPLTGMLIVYEITNRYEVILPLMLAAVISTIVTRVLYRESMYTVCLTRLGVRVGEMADLTIMRRLTVQDVPLVAPVFVHPDDSAQRLLDLSERLSVSDFVVTDRRDAYLGMVTGGDLREALVYREAIPLLQVEELQRSDLPTMTPEDTIDIVLDRFVAFDVNALAVLDSEGGAVIGLVTRSHLMRRYQMALEEG